MPKKQWRASVVKATHAAGAPEGAATDPSFTSDADRFVDAASAPKVMPFFGACCADAGRMASSP